MSLYNNVMPAENAERFVEQLFQTFDQDSNGHLDFHVVTTHTSGCSQTRNVQEFLKLTEFAEQGSIKDKLAWTFKLYDKDMSGERNRRI